MIKLLTPVTVCFAVLSSGFTQGKTAAESLENREEEDNTIVVTASRFQQPVSTILAPVTIVTRDQIDRWQEKSVAGVLRRLPGVQISQNGGLGKLSSVFIRGSNSNHTLILVDGIRLSQGGISGSSDVSQIPVAMIDRVEYIRGPRSAVYGSDAIGGVINIITGEKKGNNLAASFGSNSFQKYTASSRQQIIDSTQIGVAGSYTHSKEFDVVANIPDSRSYRQPDKDGFLSKFIWGDIKHRFSDQWNGFIRGYGYNNRSSFDADPRSTTSDVINDTRQYYSQNFDSELQFQQDNYSSQLIASYRHVKDYSYDDRLGPYDTSSSLNDYKQYNLQWGNSYHIGQGTISGGVDWEKQSTEPGSAYLAKGYNQYSTGAYITGQQQIEQFTLEGALRGDDNSKFGWNTTWQTMAGWQFIPDYRLIIGYGTAYKAPNFSQLYSSYSGNRNLQAEESKQWEVGLEGETDLINWRLSAYRSDIDNIIDYDKVNAKYYNIGKARIKGAELTIEGDTGPLNHQLSLAYVDPRNSKTNKMLTRRAKQLLNYQLDWQVMETNLDLLVNYQYVGQRYDQDFNQKDSQGNWGKRLHVGGYSQWDVALSYLLYHGLTVRTKVSNLFDKNYEKAYGYRTAGRELLFSAEYSF